MLRVAFISYAKGGHMMATPGRPNGKINLSQELDQIRRTRDLSYAQLADEIHRVTNHRRVPDCWRRICHGEVGQPQGRTLDILEQFLASVPREKRPRQARATLSRRSLRKVS